MVRRPSDNASAPFERQLFQLIPNGKPVSKRIERQFLKMETACRQYDAIASTEWFPAGNRKTLRAMSDAFQYKFRSEEVPNTACDGCLVCEEFLSHSED